MGCFAPAVISNWLTEAAGTPKIDEVQAESEIYNKLKKVLVRHSNLDIRLGVHLGKRGIGILGDVLLLAEELVAEEPDALWPCNKNKASRSSATSSSANQASGSSAN